MTHFQCKAGSKITEAWPKPGSSRPKKLGLRPAPTLSTGAPVALPNERTVSDLIMRAGTRGAGTQACQRLKGRLLERIETLRRVRMIEELMRELNKTMCLDETMTPEIDGYKNFRNGLVPLEVFGNLARYEAHIAREIEASLFLLRPNRGRLQGRGKCGRT